MKPKHAWNRKPNGTYKSTDSGESAGVAGTPINQLKEKWY